MVGWLESGEEASTLCGGAMRGKLGRDGSRGAEIGVADEVCASWPLLARQDNGQEQGLGIEDETQPDGVSWSQEVMTGGRGQLGCEETLAS